MFGVYIVHDLKVCIIRDSCSDVHLGCAFRLVECEPDVTRHHLTPDDKFILLASDGLWDVLTDQEAVDVVDSELMVRNIHLASYVNNSIC